MTEEADVKFITQKNIQKKGKEESVLRSQVRRLRIFFAEAAMVL